MPHPPTPHTPPTVHLDCHNPELSEQIHTLAAAVGIELTTPTPHTPPPHCLITDHTGPNQPPPSTHTPHRIHVSTHEPTTTDWQNAITHQATAVLVLPHQADQLLELLTTLTHPTPQPAQHLLVHSLATGSGGTTLTALLAHKLQTQQDTIVIDHDQECAHLTHHLGLASLTGYGWSDLTNPKAAIDIPTIAKALPRQGQLRALGWTTPPPTPLTEQTKTNIINTLRQTTTIVSDASTTRPSHPEATHLWVITNTDRALAETRHRGPLTPNHHTTLIIREHPTGNWSPAHIATHLDCPHYHRWPHDRTLTNPLTGHHHPGNRTTQKLITTLINQVTS